MSFQESVIIPLSLFKECKLNEISLEKPYILDNPALDSEAKMKMFSQQKILSRSKIAPRLKPAEDKPNDEFTSSIPDKYKPYANSILDFMRKHPDEVGWDESNRVRIQSNTIPFSNLRDILHHFMKTTVVTKDSDVPPGTYQLFTKLHDLGMPKSWVPARFYTRKSGREKPVSWVSY